MPEPNVPSGGDKYNTQGYQGVIATPTTSNNYVGRIDHDFSDKWRFMTSYRDYRLVSLTTSQVDIGGAIGSDKLGTPAALAVQAELPAA